MQHNSKLGRSFIQAYGFIALPVMLLAAHGTQAQESILFIGNSFTFGAGSAVNFYRPDSVTDLNGTEKGGVPALFEAFTEQAGLQYDVYLETEPGSGMDFHLDNRLAIINRRSWDTVVMHGHSLLDSAKPGDPAKLISSAQVLSATLAASNPAVNVYLTATWSRADQTYPATGAWAGKPIDAMARDVRSAYDTAASKSPAVKAVVPVGEAWTRAMQTGVADANPYDGIEFEKLNLWTNDHYHASVAGYYLEALSVFGTVTRRDPRSLGDNECAGFELGLSQQQIHALQQVAFDELATAGHVTPAPFVLAQPVAAVRCLH
jgi:hypothetical protein